MKPPFLKPMSTFSLEPSRAAQWHVSPTSSCVIPHFAIWPVLFVAIISACTGSAQTALMNGANQTGTLLVNTTNSYTFSANAGDSINLRLGTTNFTGTLRLYGPTSALLASAAGSTDDPISYAATNSGTFTATVSSYFAGGAGTFLLHLAPIPDTLFRPPCHEGRAP